MRTQIRIALLALLPACGAKTGLRVPDVVLVCEPNPPACQEPTAPPLEQPAQRTLAPPSTGRDTWCAGARPVADFAVPQGFCVHEFARVAGARVLAPHPDGSLFVSAPSRPVPSSTPPGLGAIVLLTDDRDGTAEQHRYFEADDVHGLALAGSQLYFTRWGALFRLTLRAGVRRANPADAVRVATLPRQDGRWTHSVAVRSDGRVFLSFSAGVVAPEQPPSEHGIVYEVRPDGTLDPWSRGFRNPLYVRCHPTAPHCLSSELGADGALYAIDKLVEVTPCAHYGYPRCHGRDVPWFRLDGGLAEERCAWPTHEIITMTIGTTPFGFDWERGRWPTPYRDQLFLAAHGSFYRSIVGDGAGIYVASIDPCSQRPSGPLRPFFVSTVLGREGGRLLRRPADVAFAPDGRLFVADDQHGSVYWIAPDSLRR